ncbi:MAG: GDSL-type esterase/lipase family protein [Flavobacteriaceae bacterium]
MIVFPEEGITLGNKSLKFPTTDEFFNIKEDNEVVKIDSVSSEIEELQELEFKKDSTNKIVISKLDSVILNAKLDSIRKLKRSIQGNENAIKSLVRFFNSLDKAKKEKVRIIHYGDSQIESDRITSYLRNELQKQFGGNGVGLFPVISVSKKWTLNNEHSSNWVRYAGFGRKNPLITHNEFGAMMSLCRFTPILEEENSGEKEEVEAWVKISKSKMAYRKVKSFSELNIYLKNSLENVSYNIVTGIDTLKTGIIKAETPFEKIQVKFPKTPEEIIVSFKGKDSPDILGMSLEGYTGVVMDNIPLRGSSGTLFTKQDATLLKEMYVSLAPNLIILEFGGNTIPYTKTKRQASDYGNWFKQQIRFIKKLNPDVPILVIGPSDMSYKNKTEFETYLFLEDIRDALKDATLNSDCLFWDMYESMGGKNSMPSWVNADPALANADYIHFSSKGSVKIAELFYKELMNLYEANKSIDKVINKIKNDSIEK